jgi:hypothetical protein
MLSKDYLPVFRQAQVLAHVLAWLRAKQRAQPSRLKKKTRKLYDSVASLVRVECLSQCCLQASLFSRSLASGNANLCKFSSDYFDFVTRFQINQAL